MIGQTISHYKIIEKLGEGGMGVVYKAIDTKLDRPVALKFLPPETSVKEETKARFLQEARAAAALNHNNICTIYGVDEAEGILFIAMEYVDGGTLRKSLPFPGIGDAVSVATQIGEALREAHARGIVHRDIKADNIMLTAKAQPKVMDFGLAKLKGSLRLTRTTGTVGTLAYMAPEQIQGGEADARSDIFSFGVLLFEMLTGKLPFRGEHEAAMMYSIVNEDPLPIEQLRKDVPVQIEQAILHCLEKDPANRSQSFSEVLEDLKSGWQSPVSQKPALSGIKERVRRRPAAAFGLFIVVAAVVFSLIAGPQTILRSLGFNALPDEQHLAILPFTSIGGDSTKQPLCDGLVETITSKLTQLEQFHGSLWVVPSSEVRRNKTQSPSEAYQSFGANLVITGNLQLVEGVFRLTLNLIDSRNVRQISSSVLDIRQAGFAALQDQSVTRLLEMLNLELNPPTQKVIAAGATKSDEANEEYLLGLGYLQRYDVSSNLDAAISHFQHSIEHDPDFALAFAGLGEAYWRKYETSKSPALVTPALENCEKAFQLNPRLPEVNITLGLIHSGTGQNEKALEDFRVALELSPRNDAVYRGLARAYEVSGDLTEAEATYKRAIELKPSYWAGYNELGVFYYRKGRYEEAAEQFVRVTRLTPDNVRAYSNAGGVYYMLKRYTDAQDMFERAISIKKTYAACSNLATLYYIQGSFEKAATMYEEALRLNDQDYRIWGNLGVAYYWAPGGREKAIPAFRRALQGGEEALNVNPTNAETIADLSGYHAMIGEKDKALTLATRAIRTDSSNAQAMYVVGTTYEQLGDREKALLWIGRAIEGGYSFNDVEQQPELKELRADPRYEKLREKAQQQ